jgi:8-oxo-dGTP pyrophosphatase MutT (NUDIX family)
VQALKHRIATNLAAFPRLAQDRGDLRRAAVAILISPVRDQPTYALTRRSLTMRRGAGNYALPGGGAEPGEDAAATAIRKTAEELGVALPPDAALGLLDDFVTLSGHVVTPVVLWSDKPLALRPDPVEVHAAWLVPLAELDHLRAPRHVTPLLGGEATLRMRVRGRWINPPTTAWLYQFREVALHGRWTRVGAVGQPAWTAR